MSIPLLFSSRGTQLKEYFITIHYINDIYSKFSLLQHLPQNLELLHYVTKFHTPTDLFSFPLKKKVMEHDSQILFVSCSHRWYCSIIYQKLTTPFANLKIKFSVVVT